MSYGEIVDRMWLVYSKTADRVYCFVCKLFEPTLNSSLANVGCDDWRTPVTFIEMSRKKQKSLYKYYKMDRTKK